MGHARSSFFTSVCRLRSCSGEPSASKCNDRSVLSTDGFYFHVVSYKTRWLLSLNIDRRLQSKSNVENMSDENLDRVVDMKKGSMGDKEKFNSDCLSNLDLNANSKKMGHARIVSDIGVPTSKLLGGTSASRTIVQSSTMDSISTRVNKTRLLLSLNIIDVLFNSRHPQPSNLSSMQIDIVFKLYASTSDIHNKTIITELMKTFKIQIFQRHFHNYIYFTWCRFQLPVLQRWIFKTTRWGSIVNQFPVLPRFQYLHRPGTGKSHRIFLSDIELSFLAYFFIHIY